MEFTRRNLSTLAAVMVLFGHVKRDVTSVGPLDSLLARTPAHFVPVQGEMEQLGGSYVWYDRENARWVRSGKAGPGVSASLGNRGKDHRSGAMLNTLESVDSLFYTSYPSRNATIGADDKERSALRRGYFEDLGFVGGWWVGGKGGRNYTNDPHQLTSYYVAIAFNPQSTTAVDALCSPGAAGGIFQWPNSALDAITSATKICGATTTKLKQQHAVGYLCEWVYEFALAPADNVSESCGFESCGMRNFSKRAGV